MRVGSTLVPEIVSRLHQYEGKVNCAMKSSPWFVIYRDIDDGQAQHGDT